MCCGYFLEAHDLSETGLNIKIELSMPIPLLFLTFSKGSLIIFIDHWSFIEILCFRKVHET